MKNKAQYEMGKFKKESWDDFVRAAKRTYGQLLNRPTDDARDMMSQSNMESCAAGSF